MSGDTHFSLVVGDIISDAREKTGDVVRVTEQELESSTWLLGVQGTGKSSLIEHYVWQLARRNLAKGMIIIDPHGDLVDNIIKQLPAWRVQNTYLLDITDKEFFYGINIFDAKDVREGDGDRDQAIDRVVDTFLKLFEGADRGVMLPKVLRFITSVMIANAGMSIADVPRLLKDDAFREELVKPVTHHWTREYWREYGEMTNKAKGDETRSLNNRLQTLLSMELIEYIMGQEQTTIDFRQAMDNNEILLIRLPVADYPVIAPLIGTALVTELFRTVFSYRDTPRERRRGFSLFVDEAHNFVTDQFAKLITEGRKYGLRLFIGNQTHSQLQGRNHDEILNCRTRVALRLNDDDARSMAAAFVDRTKQPKLKQLYWDVLNRLGKHESEWIYKFNENVVKRIIEIAKDDDYTHYEDAKRAVPIVEKLLIETQKQGVIPEGLLNKYLTAMEGLCEYDPPSPIFYTKERLEIKEDEYTMLTEKCLALCQEQIDNNKQDETAGTYSNELVKQIDALDKDIAIYRSEIDKHEEEKRRREKKRKRMEAYMRRVLQELLRAPIREYEKPETATDMARKLSRLESRYGYVRSGGAVSAITTPDRPGEVSPQDFENRLTTIREQTRKKYCKSREEIEESLKSKRGGLSKGLHKREKEVYSDDDEYSIDINTDYEEDADE